MTINNGHSRLYYWGTQIEVRLGDVVRVKRWFWWEKEGAVCYIPGVSPKHPEMEFEEVKQWGIRLEDGTVLIYLYAPEEFQPPKTITYVRPGVGGTLAPDEDLS